MQMNTRFTAYLFRILVIVLLLTPSGGEIPYAFAGENGVSVTSTTLAGVEYDPKAALLPVVLPFFDPKDPPTGARTFHVTYRGAENRTVPALLTLPGNGHGKPGRYPTVILVHGLGGRKEDTVLLSVAFARRGYATLAIDLPAHGERRLTDGRTFADLTLEETRRLGAVAVTDLRRGLDFLSTRSDIDSARFGCVGISLGGIFSGVFVGVEPRIAAVALWSAGGDWGKLLTESQHPFARERREKGNLPDADTVENILRVVDPLTYLASLSPRPLLLLAGTEDDVVPNICTDELFQVAGPPKKLVRYPGGHVPDLRAMTLRSLDFFDVTLRGRKESGKQKTVVSKK